MCRLLHAAWRCQEVVAHDETRYVGRVVDALFRVEAGCSEHACEASLCASSELSRRRLKS